MEGYCVYILTNKKRTVLYIGVTNNLKRRMTEHRKGVGSFFTRKYHLKILVYYEAYGSIRDAISREKQLKAGSRARKEKLIERINPGWEDMCARWFGSG